MSRTFDILSIFLARFDEARWGKGHIVFEDLNLKDDHIKWCLEEMIKSPGKTPEPELSASKFVLMTLLEIPEEERLASIDEFYM